MKTWVRNYRFIKFICSICLVLILVFSCPFFGFKSEAGLSNAIPVGTTIQASVPAMALSGNEVVSYDLDFSTQVAVTGSAGAYNLVHYYAVELTHGTFPSDINYWFSNPRFLYMGNEYPASYTNGHYTAQFDSVTYQSTPITFRITVNMQYTGVPTSTFSGYLSGSASGSLTGAMKLASISVSEPGTVTGSTSSVGYNLKYYEPAREIALNTVRLILTNLTDTSGVSISQHNALFTGVTFTLKYTSTFTSDYPSALATNVYDSQGAQLQTQGNQLLTQQNSLQTQTNTKLDGLQTLTQQQITNDNSNTQQQITNDNSNTQKQITNDNSNTQKQIENDNSNTEKMLYSYDNSDLSSSNDRLSSSLDDYGAVEDVAFNQASEVLGDYDITSNLAFGSGLISGLSFVKSFSDSFFVASGEMKIGLYVLYTMVFFSIISGLWRFWRGD